MIRTLRILPELIHGKTIVLVCSEAAGEASPGGPSNKGSTVDVIVRSADREAALDEARYLMAVLNRREG